MISYNFAKAIANIYDQVRRQNMVFCKEDKRLYADNDFVKDYSVALYLVLVVSAENNGYEIDGNTPRPEWKRHFRKEMHFLITGDHRVFLAIVDGKTFGLKDIPLKSWKNTSNHDSCWRTDGVQSPITTMMFDAWKHCFSHMPEEHLREKLRSSGVEMELDDSCDEVIRFVRIKHTAVDISDTYHRKITSVKKLTPVITFKEE
jgi:hypothetical protein